MYVLQGLRMHALPVLMMHVSKVCIYASRTEDEGFRVRQGIRMLMLQELRMYVLHGLRIPMLQKLRMRKF